MAINVTPIPRLTSLTTPAFSLGTANAAGDAITAVASNSTLLAFDAVAVDSITFGQSGSVGTATVAPRRDHVHAMQAVTVATQEEMEAGTSVATFVTPGRTQYHAGVAKAWAQVDFNTSPGNFTEQQNMSSFTDSGVGTGICYILADFTSANYAMATTAIIAGDYRCSVGTEFAGSFTIDVMNGSGTKVDTVCSVVCFGEQV